MIRQWLRTARRARRDDAGFTLPELIVSIVILAFIMGAIGLTMVVVLKNTSAAADRVTAGGGAQTLSVYFPGDVQSAMATGGGFTGKNTTGCVGDTSGDDQGSANVVTLLTANGSGDLVSYRTKLTPSGDYELWRVSCTRGAWVRRIVAQGIVDPAKVVVTARDVRGVVLDGLVQTSPTIGLLELAATVGASDPVQLRVSGTPRTPGLPTPCTVTSATPPTVQLGPGDRPADPVAFTITTSGLCAALSVAVGDADPAFSVDLGPGPNSWTGIAPDARWPAPSATVARVLDAGQEIHQLVIDVRPEPCRVIGLTAPARLRIEQNGSAAEPTTFTLATTESCTVSRLHFLPGRSDPFDLTPRRVSAGSFAFTLDPEDGHRWAVGDNAIEVFDAAGKIGDVNLFADPADCRVVDGTRVLLIDANGLLRNNSDAAPLSLDVRTSGNCLDEMRATAAPPNGLDHVLTADGAAHWTVPGLAYYGEITWSPGPMRVNVTTRGTDAGSFVVRVDDCELIVPPTQDIQVKEGEVESNQEFRFSTDGHCGTRLSVQFQPDNDRPAIVLRTDTGNDGPGLQRTWRVQLDNHLRWPANGTVLVSVFDDAAPAPSPTAFLGTFDALGVDRG